MEQLMFCNDVTCEHCIYGKNLGAKDFACINREVYGIIKHKVNKSDFCCGHGQLK